MYKRSTCLWLCVCLILVLNLAPTENVLARPGFSGWGQQAQPTAADLINAVNALRLAHGLRPLKTHPILMQTAQSQANALLATEGAVGHSRPGGISYTQQLLMLGYPLAGDLSLGGYRAENFIFGNGLTPEAAVELWQGDEPHTNTMLSPNYLDIGAGVAIDADGVVYFVIDCARPTGSGLPQEEAVHMLTSTVGAPENALSQYIIPLVRSTARLDGDVLHHVRYGQSLWSIAIEYGTTINSIRALNNLDDTTVYEGQILLVQKGATQPPPVTVTPASPASPTLQATPTPAVAQSPTPSAVEVEAALEATSTETPTNGSSFSLLIGILLIAVVIGGGTLAWFIREPEAAKNHGRNQKT